MKYYFFDEWANKETEKIKTRREKKQKKKEDKKKTERETEAATGLQILPKEKQT